jgi:rhodanese-related sulfurtransferase
MTKTISCKELAATMSEDNLFAVFDVRERGEFNNEQILFSTSLPRSQIEFRIAELVPNSTIPIIVYDEGGPRAELAGQTLTELGYTDVALLQGGLKAWGAHGHETVSGVNVPSKAFGEKVHHDRSVPDLAPEELKKLIDDNPALPILDMRTPEEYGRFCIPGGVNVPGGELIHWAGELRQKPMVIVNCAGRTRSIIGAAGLRRLGLNNVRALKNGTMGWVLAGYQLEQKPARFGVAKKDPNGAQQLALRIAREENIAWTTAGQLAVSLAKKPHDLIYLIDVRSEAEFAAGHIDGSINVPGGQAVQRSDDFVAVRNGQIVFVSDQSARAVMTAYWYGQMGFKNVCVLQGGLDAWSARGGELVGGATVAEPLGLAAAKQSASFVDALTLGKQLSDAALVLLDVSSSLEYEAAHVPGAKWLPRGWADIKVPELFADRSKAIVVSCADGRQSIFAARQLKRAGYGDVRVLEGGLRSWNGAGFATASGLTDCLLPANDVVLSPSIRGNKEDMQKYLDWEVKLKH